MPASGDLFHAATTWGRCCSHTISWWTPWHPPRSRPVRAPCLPRSRQLRPLHSCCRGTDPGGVFERCDHLCCGRYLCNRAEICLNAAHKNRDQPACFCIDRLWLRSVSTSKMQHVEDWHDNKTRIVFERGGDCPCARAFAGFVSTKRWPERESGKSRQPKPSSHQQPKPEHVRHR